MDQPVHNPAAGPEPQRPGAEGGVAARLAQEGEIDMPDEDPDRRHFMLSLGAGSLALGLGATVSPARAAPDATALLQKAWDNWRSKSSRSTTKMIIHRPQWERTLIMKSWTRGRSDALVRFISPPKDAGNATLKLGNNTWIYNPKIRQVVKLPASLLGQSWMGSDFSYSDLARSDDVLRHYTHRIIATSRAGGHKAHTVEALPRRGAPVVWGKQEITLRDDGILLEIRFFDQDMKLARQMKTDRIRRIGGRIYPTVLTMRKSDTPGSWTRLETLEAEFDIPLPDWIFTRSNLANPRE